MKRLLVIAAILLALAGCKDGNGPETGRERPVVTGVQLTAVQFSQVPEYYETAATIKARSTSIISSRLMAEVTAVMVREGDMVKTGQVLLTLDNSDVIQKVAAAEAGCKEAKAALAAARQNMALADLTYERYRNLFNGKALSQQELDQVETRKKVAALEEQRLVEMVKRLKAGLAEARVFLDFATITSPVTGVVTARKIDAGSMAAPGLPLFRVEDTSGFELHAAINEKFVGALEKGMPVSVAFPVSGRQLTGKLTEIIPAVDPGSRTFLVKIALAGPDLQSGLYAKLKIPVGMRQAILLPADALIRKGQLTGVYLVNRQNIVTYRLVRVGGGFDGKLEVLAGLRKGERVITGGLENAVDGGIFQEG